jgi:hypothetical protein
VFPLNSYQAYIINRCMFLAYALNDVKRLKIRITQWSGVVSTYGHRFFCINDDDIDAHSHKGARIPRRLEADHLEVIVYYVTLMMTYILDAHSQKGARSPRRLGMFIISRLCLCIIHLHIDPEP